MNETYIDLEYEEYDAALSSCDWGHLAHFSGFGSAGGYELFDDWENRKSDGDFHRNNMIGIRANSCIQKRLTPNQIEACQWAKSIAYKKRFIIFDTETTGLGMTDEIISIAIIDQTQKILINTLLRPSKKIPLAASKVHGIYDIDVVDAPRFNDIYPYLRMIFERNVIIGYNVDFDIRMLLQTCEQWGLPRINMSLGIHCAMRWYAKYNGEWNDYHKDYKWKKLTEAAAHFNIETVGAHDAATDCIMTLKVIKALAEKAS